MRARLLPLALVPLLLAPAAPALAAEGRQFPDPATGIREDTPDDPGFDCSEPDDEDSGTVEPCATIWDAQPQLWGFAPASTEATARHKSPARMGEPMRAGIGADAAWKTSTGRPDVPVAILDTGIRWDEAPELRRQVFLNQGELRGRFDDEDGDGVVEISDLEGEVDPTLGANGPKGLLDGQDVIVALSDGVDDDGNGYVDDLAGWDFFDDDNDPYDASSYSSARNHGTGRANDAVREGDDGAGEIGVCPKCSFIPVRVWDTFVVSGDHYGMGAAYAADAGAEVIEVALGALSNSPTAQAATRYAYDKGVTLAVVSSDLNTANHNFPTTYPEVIGINGTVADTYGLGAGEANEFGLPLGEVGVGAQAPVGTYFRNSGLTQYGAHLHVSAVGDTGSFATGQAAGAFGLLISAAKERGVDLTPNEVKQIITLTAEDVVPEDTVGIGVPDPAKVGFDERFAYGRMDLAAATAVFRDLPTTAASAAELERRLPPSVLLRTPRWWQVVDPTTQAQLPVVADTGSRAATHTVVVEAAKGIEPSDSDFRQFLTGGPYTGHSDSRAIGTVPVSALAALPAAVKVPFAADPSPTRDVNANAVTVRIRVTDSNGEVAEDRRVLWLSSDPSRLPGFPVFTDVGGESSPRLADLDGDARLDIVLTDSAGRTRVLDSTGRDAAFWNGGRPVVAEPLREIRSHLVAPAYASGRVPAPRGVSLTPVVADLDGDGSLEVVVTNSGGTVTAYDRTGAQRFQVGVDRSLSLPPLRTRAYHVKTGFFGAASVGDVRADRPGLEVVAGGLDGRVYVWDANGAAVPGFPRSLNSDDTGPDARGAELITIPTLAQLDADPQLEIAVGGSEVVDPSGGLSPPESPGDLVTAFRTLVSRVEGEAGAASLAHALDGDGSTLPGWPAVLNALVPDVLPFVGPAHQFAAADTDGDGLDELLVSSTTGEVVRLGPDGTRQVTMESLPGTSAATLTDPSKVFNLFEYASVGDLEGLGQLSAFKGGLTTGGVTNLLLVGQNNAQDHVVQGWDLATGAYRPRFPVKVEDYTLLSQPAVADVDGLPGNEVVQGTGLYFVHAFDSAGVEVPGYPKFTGGWNYATPAFGDLDGDGTTEMVSTTREGYLFAWSTGGDATSNEQWWGAAHDERSTSRYGTDARPPARVQDLRRDGTGVRWSTTGDDWRVGTPASTVVLVDGVRRDLSGTATSVPDVPPTATVEVWAVDDAGLRSLSAVLGPFVPSPRPSSSPVVSPAPSTSPVASTSPTASPAARPVGAGFHVLRPTRLLDTRSTGGAVRAGQERSVPVTGRAGVPQDGVSAVLVNTTVTGVTGDLDLQVLPSGDRPGRRTSNLNAVAGQTVANLVEVPVGDDGRIVLSVSSASAHVVLDVVGWFGTDGDDGDGYVPLAPERRFDSRATRPVEAGSDRVVPLFEELPPGATAAVVSVTAVGATGATDLALYEPGDRPQRRTSNLNLGAGPAVANLVVVPVDERGRVAVSNAAGSVHVALDLVGYYTDRSDAGFAPLTPSRVLDTRQEGGAVRAGQERRLAVLGRGGVPATGVDAVLVNVTSVGSTTAADLQVTAAGRAPSRRTSNLNVEPGQTVPVLVLVEVGDDGAVGITTSQGRTDVVVDVVGYVRTP